MTDLPPIELFKHGDQIIIRIGLVMRCMSVGDWAKLIARPGKLDGVDECIEKLREAIRQDRETTPQPS